MLGTAVRVSLVVIGLLAVVFAQSPTTPPATSPTDQASLGQIGAGGTLVAELSKSVDAKKAKPGDKVEARVTMDALSHGAVAIPRGAKIIGHVVDAKARIKEATTSTVEIVFDRVVLKNGREMPLKATIQAVGAPMQMAPTASEGITDASTGMPGVRSNMPDGVGGSGRTGTTGYPQRPVGSMSGGEPPTDNPGQNRSQAPPLGPTSVGVVGMKGISLSKTEKGSAISSTSENVHLNSGTQLVLRITEQ